MDTIVGTLALDTLARVRALPAQEATGGIERLHVDRFGGTAGNVAMALAKLGTPPRLVSSVGPDFEGSSYDQALRHLGVRLDGITRVEAPTSRAYLFFDAEGRQVTYFHAGASRAFSASPDDIQGRAHFCAGEISRYPDLMAVADWVSFDPGQEVFHRDLDQIVACIPHADLVFVNRHELAHLEQHGWGVARILEEGPETLVESRGAEGTLVHTRSGRFAVPAIPTRVVDPTGAGDAHRAGYLFALDKGCGPGVAARFASVLGTFAVEEYGGQAGQPGLKAAVERYQEAFGERPF